MRTKKTLAKIATDLAWAERLLAHTTQSARYWAADARRALRRGDGSGALGSFLIAMYDRRSARGWRTEVRRLRGLAA